MRRLPHVVALSALALAGAAPAAAPPRYALAFGSCPSPRNCTVRLGLSRDGVRFPSPRGIGAGAGDQPALVRRGSTLYLYTGLAPGGPGLTATLRRVRLAGGFLVIGPPVAVEVALAAPADGALAGASLAVDTDGSLTLVYALRFEPGAGACPVAGEACVKLRSAGEVLGSDGSRFEADSGNRIVVGFPPADAAVAPAAFAAQRGFAVLLAGPGGCLHVLTTRRLAGTYRLLPACLARGAGAASGFWNPRLQEYWLYAAAAGGIARAVATRLDRPLPEGAFRPLAALGKGLRGPSFAPLTPP